MGCNVGCLKLKWLFCKKERANTVHKTILSAFKTEDSIDDLIRTSIDPKVVNYSTLHKRNKSKIQLETFKIEKVPIIP